MIDEQTKQLIIDSARIEDVVSDFIQLRRKGAGFVGLCPFHKDRHPSFIVTPSKNICKCFACGEGGTPISFIMKLQHLSFSEALRYLAEKYGIPIPERELTEEEQRRRNRREALYLANEVAAKFFSEQLLATEQGLDIALPYFTSRGVRPETIKTFGLGYSPTHRQALVEYVHSQGYDLEPFVETGLCFPPQDGRPSGDRYHERVIFPIYNVSGRVVGFGGRTMRTGDKIAKYINSPESPIYDKSSELYGLFQAKRAIAKEDRCIIVEGYMDVIALHQVGIQNVVATSGTALTERQVQLLHRFSRNVMVLFDGDSAGIKAALRSIDLLLHEGMQIKVLLLPDGEDPDDFVRKRTRNEIDEYIETHQQDFLTFKGKQYAPLMEGNPQRKAELLRDILRSVASIPDSIERIVYVQQMAQMYGVTEELLLQQIKQERFKQEREYHYTPTPTTKTNENEKTTASVSEELIPSPSPLDQPLPPLERDLARLLVRYGDRLYTADTQMDGTNEDIIVQIPIAIQIKNELEQDDIHLSSPLAEALLCETVKFLEDQNLVAGDGKRKGGRTCTSYLLNHEIPQISSLSVDLMATPYRLTRHSRKNLQVPMDENEEYDDKQLQEMVRRVIYSLKLHYVNQQIALCYDQLRVSDTSQEQIEKILEELDLWQEIRKGLAQSLGDRVIMP